MRIIRWLIKAFFVTLFLVYGPLFLYVVLIEHVLPIDRESIVLFFISIVCWIWVIKKIKRTITAITVRPTASVNEMTGIEYEKYVAKLLRFDGYSNISTTKASGDFGVDIIATQGSKKYAIQCKKHSKPVGVHAIQEVSAGMQYYQCDFAVVITNSTFTPAARKMAERLGVKLMEHYT